MKHAIFTIVGLIIVFIALFTYMGGMDPIDYVELTTSISAEEMVVIKSVQQTAFAQATKCGGRNEQNYEDIGWFIYPDKEIVFKEGNDELNLYAWYDPINNSIWVAYPHRKTMWVLIHESLHAQGWVGHPDVPFRTCNVRAEDH